MKRAGTLFVIALVGFGACSTKTDTFRERASVLVDNLAAGNFAAIEAKFDVTMKAQLPLAQLKNAWRTYREIEGAYEKHGSSREVKRGDITVERVPVTMYRAKGEVRVSYHPDGTIAGLYFLKPGAPAP